jgi:hypothetical protein
MHIIIKTSHVDKLKNCGKLAQEQTKSTPMLPITAAQINKLLLLLLHRTNTADQADGPEIALVIR